MRVVEPQDLHVGDEKSGALDRGKTSLKAGI
jgi:hypothetical protein